mmetsp:Transcript_7511/g.18411  ORF Transcript_7511/g.18411 Transcript_7511/m.18411 type:complete len:83 (+) Transcript_7511:277-525(+)
MKLSCQRLIGSQQSASIRILLLTKSSQIKHDNNWRFQLPKCSFQKGVDLFSTNLRKVYSESSGSQNHATEKIDVGNSPFTTP